MTITKHGAVSWCAWYLVSDYAGTVHAHMLLPEEDTCMISMRGGPLTSHVTRVGRALAAKQLPHLKWSDHKPPLLHFMVHAALRKD